RHQHIAVDRGVARPRFGNPGRAVARVQELIRALIRDAGSIAGALVRELERRGELLSPIERTLDRLPISTLARQPGIEQRRLELGLASGYRGERRRPG